MITQREGAQPPATLLQSEYWVGEGGIQGRRQWWVTAKSCKQLEVENEMHGGRDTLEAWEVGTDFDRTGMVRVIVLQFIGIETTWGITYSRDTSRKGLAVAIMD